MRVACFIDRDGGINEMGDRRDGYVNERGEEQRYTAPWSYAEFKLLPQVKEALEILGQVGLVRVLVTNQPDVAYGNLSPEDHERIMAETAVLPLDDVYVCPHRWDDGCGCKKPKPGMLLAATDRWDLDLAGSFIVGDTKSDIEAGEAVGCRTVLVQTDYNQDVQADFYVRGLFSAAQLIRILLPSRPSSFLT